MCDLLAYSRSQVRRRALTSLIGIGGLTAVSWALGLWAQFFYNLDSAPLSRRATRPLSTLRGPVPSSTMSRSIPALLRLSRICHSLTHSCLPTPHRKRNNRPAMRRRARLQRDGARVVRQRVRPVAAARQYDVGVVRQRHRRMVDRAPARPRLLSPRSMALPLRPLACMALRFLSGRGPLPQRRCRRLGLTCVRAWHAHHCRKQTRWTAGGGAAGGATRPTTRKRAGPRRATTPSPTTRPPGRTRGTAPHGQRSRRPEQGHPPAQSQMPPGRREDPGAMAQQAHHRSHRGLTAPWHTKRITLSHRVVDHAGGRTRRTRTRPTGRTRTATATTTARSRTTPSTSPRSTSFSRPGCSTCYGASATPSCRCFYPSYQTD